MQAHYRQMSIKARNYFEQQFQYNALFFLKKSFYLLYMVHGHNIKFRTISLSDKCTSKHLTWFLLIVRLHQFRFMRVKIPFCTFVVAPLDLAYIISFALFHQNSQEAAQLYYYFDRSSSRSLATSNSSINPNKYSTATPSNGLDPSTKSTCYLCSTAKLRLKSLTGISKVHFHNFILMSNKSFSFTSIISLSSEGDMRGGGLFQS